MALEGLGKEIWHGLDSQEYINQERASWKQRNGSEAKNLRQQASDRGKVIYKLIEARLLDVSESAGRL